MKDKNRKDHILFFCINRRADLVDFASVERWDVNGLLPEQIRIDAERKSFGFAERKTRK